MTVKELMELGLTEEQAKKVSEAVKASIDGKYEPKERNEQLREQLKAEREKVADRDRQISSLTESASASDELRKQIEKMKEDNKKKDEEHSKRLNEAKMSGALRENLAGKVHDVDLAITLFDTSKIKLDDNGSIKEGFKDQLEALEKSKSYLFVKDSGKNQTRPAMKLFGEGAKEGQKNDSGKDENPGLKFAKEAAARKNSAVERSNKAAEAYFGTNNKT